MKSCLLSLLLACVVLPVRAENLAAYTWVTDSEISPNGGSAVWNQGMEVWGRIHTNGGLIISSLGLPHFHGLVSQGAWAINGLDEDEYPMVFPGGLRLLHGPMDFTFDGLAEDLRALCVAAHHWPAHLDSLDLTTLIRFDGSVYHAAQYAEAQISGSDTTWTVPWATYPLPQPPAEAPLIWIEGVGRVKGVVQGRVTVLGSDSLFIMGDLITSDTILEPCGSYPPQEGSPFGTVPPGSPNRIGLIGEKDVFIAATLENGFANGLNSPSLTCDLPNDDPVVTVCGQGRRDVIIAASVLALGCSFSVEYWKTTAWGANMPEPTDAPWHSCADSSFTQVTIWDNQPGGLYPDCLGANETSDRRGTLWFCGSFAQRRRGYILLVPYGTIGPVTVGYSFRDLRVDPNLALDPPPFWPDVSWDTSVQPSLTTGPHSACDGEASAVDFLQDWEDSISLQVPHGSFSVEDSLSVRTWLRGDLIDRSPLPPSGIWQPTLDLAPLLSEPSEIHLDLAWRDWGLNEFGDWIALGPERVAWNAGGSACYWLVGALDEVQPAAPAAFALSQPWPNPFNPVTHVELTLPTAGAVRLEVFDLAGRREAVIHDGPLAAGARSFTIDGAAWPAGLHLLRVTQAGGAETRKLLLIK